MLIKYVNELLQLNAGFERLIFFVMMSVAAAKGVYQLIRNPSYWEKTFHGLSSRPDSQPVETP